MKASTRSRLTGAISLLENAADFNELYQMYKSGNAALANRIKLSFSKGDKVQFTAKSGKLILGTIMAINVKNIRIKEDSDKPFAQEWNVHPSFLSARS